MRPEASAASCPLGAAAELAVAGTVATPASASRANTATAILSAFCIAMERVGRIFRGLRCAKGGCATTRSFGGIGFVLAARHHMITASHHHFLRQVITLPPLSLHTPNSVRASRIGLCDARRYSDSTDTELFLGSPAFQCFSLTFCPIMSCDAALFKVVPVEKKVAEVASN